MKILDINNNEIFNPDLNKGYLMQDKIFKIHHSPTKFQPEKSHIKIINIYPNGGKDVEKIIDSPMVEEKAGWDEYENIQRYIEYTPEELAQINKPSRLDTLESAIAYIAMKTGNLEALKNVRKN